MRSTFAAAGLNVAVLVTLLFSAHSGELEDASPDKLVSVKYTKAAVIYPQPRGVKPFKFVRVPYFPGTEFYKTSCGGGPDLVDRGINVTKDKIVYKTDFGAGINTMHLEYAFATATLNITVASDNWPKTFKADRPVATSILQLSALWDDASDKDVRVVNDGSRQAAINALQVLMKYLRPFARKNKLAACRAFLTGEPKWWYEQPYNPKVEVLYKYLKSQSDALKKVANS